MKTSEFVEGRDRARGGAGLETTGPWSMAGYDGPKGGAGLEISGPCSRVGCDEVSGELAGKGTSAAS